MATFKITPTTTVAELKKQFSQEVGGVLRIYEGRSEASESATLASLGATPKEWECRTSRTVGSFEKAFLEEFNLKVKVYTRDNWVKVLDDITLETASKLPNGMTKAKMEEYVSNYSKSGKPVNENKTTEKNAAVEVPEEYKGLPVIEIKTKEIDVDKDSSEDDFNYPDSPTVGVVFHGYEKNGEQACVFVCEDHDELCFEAGEFIECYINDDEDIPVRVIESAELVGYGKADDPEEISGVIGCALNEYYDGGFDHERYYSWDDWFTNKAIFVVDDVVFLAHEEGYIDFINLSTEQLEILKKESIKSKIEDLDFSEVAIQPCKFGYKYGFVNEEGNFVIEPKFDEADDFYNGFAKVKVDGKWGYIDTKGNYLVEPKFDNMGGFEDGLAYVKVDDKWGYIDTKGNFVIEPKFDDAYLFEDGCAKVELDGKYGYIDTKGNFVIEPKFDDVRDFEDGCAKVKVDGKWGAIDKHGEWVEEPIYETPYKF